MRTQERSYRFLAMVDGLIGPAELGIAARQAIQGHAGAHTMLKADDDFL
jgi:hypothetical protein